MFSHIGFTQLLLLVVLTVGLCRVRAWLPGSGFRAWQQRHTFGLTGARWPRVLLLELTELVLAGVFLLVGGAKLIGRPDMVALFQDIGIGQWFRYVTGTVEVAGAALLVIPFVSGASAILLGAVMIVATLVELFVLHRPPIAAMSCLSGHTFVAWARISHRHRRWLHGDVGMPRASTVQRPSRAQSLNARWNFMPINERRRRVRQSAATGLFCVTAFLPARLLAQATVRGVLYDDATGQPVRGTVMVVDPSTDEPVTYAATDSLGQFALRASSGVYQLAAVRPGWTRVLSAPVTLENGEQLTIRVPIDAHGTPRNSIAVVEHVQPSTSKPRAAVDRRGVVASGSETRRAASPGLHFDRKQLADSPVCTLGEFLQNMAGLDVVDPTSTASMHMTRDAGMTGVGTPSGGACHVGWFIDGHRVDLRGRTDPLTDSLGSMTLDTIEAIDVFRGISEMPLDFAEPDLRCGAISVWTRM